MHRLHALPLLLTLAVLAWGCGDDGPTGPDTADLEILVLGGNHQAGEPDSLLPIPLEVRVQSLNDGSGEAGIEVRWEVLEGVGARLDHVKTETDSAGAASVRLTLGPELGRYRVQASVRGMLSSPAEFEAEAILRPELILVPTEAVSAGDTIRLGGRNFSRDPEENVVTFSGVRGRVTTATTTDLTVEVPSCLPTRGTQVRVRIGGLVTAAHPLQVLGGDDYLLVDRGEDRIFDLSGGWGCVRLPSSAGARYLVVPHTTGTVGGGTYEVTVLGLGEEEIQVRSWEPLERGTSPPEPRGRRPGVPEAHWEWESKLRGWEEELVRTRLGALQGVGLEAAPQPETAPRPDPAVGDRREFNVLNSENQFDKVTAEIRHITDRSLVYMDLEAPPEGFSPTDLARLAGQFENPIYPTVTEHFGWESDLDENGRVVILLTPAVNRLTPEGSDGYVGGFFFGLDLLGDRSGSNNGEIFYAVVPDPAGLHGPPLARSTLLQTLPAILAHEFEHMVHFNQRVLLAGAESQDALWLSEALAQMAEDLVGAAYQELGDPEEARAFRIGNWSRARRFLLDPGRVSVLATLPPGTLAERGAGWLLLKYLHGHDEGGILLASLTGSKSTGVENLAGVLGRPWGDVIPDWAGAMYLDGTGLPVRDDFRFTDLNLRYALSLFDGNFPLEPPVFGDHPFSVGTSLSSSAPAYYIITTPAVGGLSLNVSGPDGRPPDPASGLRLLLVRLY